MTFLKYCTGCSCPLSHSKPTGWETGTYMSALQNLGAWGTILALMHQMFLPRGNDTGIWHRNSNNGGQFGILHVIPPTQAVIV